MTLRYTRRIETAAERVLKMNNKTKTVVGVGLISAIVVVLQLLAAYLPVFPFTITLSLVPMLVGAALYGWWAGAWLGFVFGFMVLLTNAGAFLAVNVLGTIITCLVKGMAAGAVAGLIYKALEKKNRLVATILAAFVEPFVNTGIFLLGCVLFFMDTINGWASALGFASAGSYLIFGMCGVNFLIELGVNLVLSPAIVHIIKIGRRTVGVEK